MLVRRHNLTLRALTRDDRSEWVRAMAESEELHRPWSPHAATGLEERFLAQVLKHEEGSCFKGVACTDAGDILAWANLNDIMRGVSQTANAGWSVRAAFAGQGVASNAVSMMLDLAFALPPHGLGLHRVAAGIMPSNTRSLRVAEKCGFRREGFAKKLIQIAGTWEDHVLYAKLEEEHIEPLGRHDVP